MVFASATRDADAERAAAVEKAIAEGNGEEALERAQLALEYVADSYELYELASRAAEAAGELDLALWFLRRSRNLAEELEEDERPSKAWLEEIDSRRALLDPRHGTYDASMEVFAQACFELGKSAARRDLWANAVELFEACKGTSLEKDALKELAKIYKKDDAVDALIASGLDIEFEDPKQKKSRAWIEKEDLKRSAWDKRHEATARGGYEVQSNVGYEFTQQMAQAVDQVNLFLRKTYQHKVQGQRMRDCKVYLHKDQEEMFAVWNSKFGPFSGGVMAFFAPGDNIVVAFDQRSRGDTTQDTMETVSHELSHQFLRDITKNLVPAWINEGSACYLEGTVLLDNGRVIANLVAEGRLESLVQMFGMLEGNRGALMNPADPESKYLENVITYFQPGSYSGAYYPWGWGLVYFMRNYENELGERIYQEPFEEYVATFKSGGKRALKEEFVEQFVTGVGVDGVETFDDFYEYWKAWIRDLEKEHFGGEEVIGQLLERAEVQLENGYLENALETFGRVLRKDRRQIVALWYSAEANRELGNDDVAMYYYRKVVEWANAQIGIAASEDTGEGTTAVYRVPGIGKTAEELLEEAYGRMMKVNDDITIGLREATTTLRDELVSLADAYATEESMPRMSLATLSRVEDLVGPSGPQLNLQAQVLESDELDLRQRRRLRVDDGLASWGQVGNSFEADGEAIVGRSPHIAYATYADLPAEEYRFEVTLQLLDSVGTEGKVIGIFIGAGVGERKIVGWESFGNSLVRLDVGPEGPELDGKICSLGLGDGEPVVLAMDVSPDGVTFYVDGEEVGSHRYDADEVAGRIGLVVQGAEARFSDMRMIY